ncbi:hypothetical protein EUX98_g9310, partial [Antrodiella citrinella]
VRCMLLFLISQLARSKAGHPVATNPPVIKKSSEAAIRPVTKNVEDMQQQPKKRRAPSKLPRSQMEDGVERIEVHGSDSDVEMDDADNESDGYIPTHPTTVSPREPHEKRVSSLSVKRDAAQIEPDSAGEDHTAKRPKGSDGRFTAAQKGKGKAVDSRSIPSIKIPPIRNFKPKPSVQKNTDTQPAQLDMETLSKALEDTVVSNAVGSATADATMLQYKKQSGVVTPAGTGASIPTSIASATLGGVPQEGASHSLAQALLSMPPLSNGQIPTPEMVMAALTNQIDRPVRSDVEASQKKAFDDAVQAYKEQCAKNALHQARELEQVQASGMKDIADIKRGTEDLRAQYSLLLQSRKALSVDLQGPAAAIVQPAPSSSLRSVKMMDGPTVRLHQHTSQKVSMLPAVSDPVGIVAGSNVAIVSFDGGAVGSNSTENLLAEAYRKIYTEEQASDND